MKERFLELVKEVAETKVADALCKATNADK